MTWMPAFAGMTSLRERAISLIPAQAGIQGQMQFEGLAGHFEQLPRYLKIFAMRLGVPALMLLIAMLLLPMSVQGQMVELTPNERGYLDELGEITMCVDPDWEPYERMDARGNFTGIAADLVEIVSQRLSIPFVIVPTTDWGETLQVSRDAGCMLIPFLNQTPAREEWLIFTEPLFTNPNVFITRNEHDYISNPAELVERTVVLPHGTSMEEHLRRDYPNLKIITVDDEHEVYRRVSAGEADMSLRSLTIAAYTIRKDGWFNLKIAGQPPQDHYMNRLRMGVLKDMPELRDILNKAVATITPGERERIVNEHVNIVVEQPFDYSLFYKIAGGVFLVLAGIVLWNIRLRHLRDSLGTTNEQLRQAMEKLVESEELFRNVIESTSFALSVITVQGKILYASPRALEMFGIEAGVDLSSVRVPDLWAEPDGRQKWVAELQATGLVKNYEAPMRTPSGRVFWVMTSGKIITYKGQTCVVSNQHDITERKQIEDALRESERRHRIIFENSPLGMFYLDVTGTIVACNDQFVRHMGSSRDKLIGFSLTTKAPAPIQDVVRKALAGDQSLYEGLYTSVTGGKTSYLRMIANPVQPDVSPTPVIATVEDITERKRIEEAVVISEKRLQQLAEQSRTVTWVVDNQGRYTFISPVAEKVLGYRPEELVNRKHFYDLTLESERESIKTLGLEAIRNAAYLMNVENAVMARDGSIVWMLTNGMPLLGEDGQVVGYQGSDMDITERKRVEMALKISEQRYRHISENTGDVIWKLDLQTHRFTYVSPSVQRLRGYTPEEIMAQPVEASMTPESYELISKSLPRRIKALLSGDESVRVLTSNVDQPCKDGRVVHTEVVTTLISDDQGRIVEILGVSRDVTERRRAEVALRQALFEADQATRAKSAFLANMSHEIRTPMNAVIGMTHLALRTDLTPKQQSYLTRIDGAARSLLGIINDILDFSKIEAGKLELEQVPFDLGDVFVDLAAIVGLKAEEKNLKLHFAIAPDTPDHLIGDPLRLGQVLTNLLGNAVKFTEQGEVVVEVEEVKEEVHGSRFNGSAVEETANEPRTVNLRFTVRDTGIGMDETQISRLFQAFTQADSSITRKHGGTGLGLAICKQLVALMGGNIQVRSTPGQGSTFSFTVRLERADEVKSAKRQAQPASLGQGATGRQTELAGRRVLLVEDNLLNRELVVELLSDLGVQVEIAVNGREGVHRATTEPFDLILMDVQMPEMDGYAATRRIREAEVHGSRFSGSTVGGGEVHGSRFNGSTVDGIDVGAHRGAPDGVAPPAPFPDNTPAPTVNREPGTVNHDRRTPIIAMTAHAMAGDREKSLETGMDDHLTKPIDPDLLRDALLRWMPEGGRQKEEGGRRKEEGAQEASSPVHPSAFSLQPTFPPPFDSPAALERCKGNHALLRRLILVFERDYADALPRLRGLLKDGQFTEAQRLAHSLKGVAATLDVLDLAKAAGAVELALAGGQTDNLDDLLPPLDAALLPAVKAATSLSVQGETASLTPDNPAGTTTPRPLSPETQISLDALRKQIQTNNIKARKTFSEIREEILGRGMGDDVTELEASLERLDFQKALEIVERIEAGLPRSEYESTS